MTKEKEKAKAYQQGKEDAKAGKPDRRSYAKVPIIGSFIEELGPSDKGRGKAYDKAYKKYSKK